LTSTTFPPQTLMTTMRATSANSATLTPEAAAPTNDSLDWFAKPRNTNLTVPDLPSPRPRGLLLL